MHRAEREIIDRLGVPGLTRVLRDLLDQERLIRLAHACGLEYPGMRARSQPRERLLQDLAEKAGHDEAARRAVLKTLQKETGAQRRAWDRLDAEPQAARVRDGGGEELFLAASSRGAEAVEAAFQAALTAPPPEPVAETLEDSDLEGVKSLSDLAAMVNDLVDDEGRATFWCPCGRMMWMQGHGWMVSLDFVMRLARGIRQHHEEEYEAMLLMLSHLMPQEIHRVRAALGEDV